MGPFRFRRLGSRPGGWAYRLDDPPVELNWLNGELFEIVVPEEADFPIPTGSRAYSGRGAIAR